MPNINTMTADFEVLYYGLIFVGLMLFIFFILLCISVVNINGHLKELVDLEYKKYNENKGMANNNLVDDQSVVDE